MSVIPRSVQRRMSMLNRGMFSSETDEWATPQALFDALNREFRFTLDACATAENTKCEHYFTREQDGLARDWGEYEATVWCNPPYGREIEEWILKAWEASQKGAVVVMLIPARTDTDYWHRYVMSADEIRFIRGRVRFGNAENSAPFPSALVVFRDRGRKVPSVRSWP